MASFYILPKTNIFFSFSYLLFYLCESMLSAVFFFCSLIRFLKFQFFLWICFSPLLYFIVHCFYFVCNSFSLTSLFYSFYYLIVSFPYLSYCILYHSPSTLFFLFLISDLFTGCLLHFIFFCTDNFIFFSLFL